NSELVVQAGANNVLVEFHVAAASGAIEFAEIDIEIFGLDRPVRREGIFSAGANGPAELGRVVGANGRHARLDIAVSGAGRDIGQEAVDAVTSAKPRRTEPITFRLTAGGAKRASRRTLRVIPVEVALDAEDGLAPLVIVTDGAAEQRAFGRGVRAISRELG